MFYHTFCHKNLRKGLNRNQIIIARSNSQFGEIIFGRAFANFFNFTCILIDYFFNSNTLSRDGRRSENLEWREEMWWA